MQSVYMLSNHTPVPMHMHTSTHMYLYICEQAYMPTGNGTNNAELRVVTHKNIKDMILCLDHLEKSLGKCYFTINHNYWFPMSQSAT